MEYHPAIAALASVVVKLSPENPETPLSPATVIPRGDANELLIILAVQEAPRKENEDVTRTIDSFVRYCIGHCKHC